MSVETRRYVYGEAEPGPEQSQYKVILTVINLASEAGTISNIGLQAEDRGRTSDFETNCARPTYWAALAADVCVVKTAFGATRGVDRVVFATWIWRGRTPWLGA